MPELVWHDRSRMDSALNAIRNGYYTDILHAAAALAYYVNKAHALHDGNKRMTLVILYTFLLLNGYEQHTTLRYNVAVAFTEWLAASDQNDKQQVIDDIRVKISETITPLTNTKYLEIFGIDMPESVKSLHRTTIISATKD